MAGIKVSVATCGDTLIGHAQLGDIHGVLVLAHKVMVFNDDGGWFAQGLEFDHFSQGETEKEAMENYNSSFKLNVQKHLELYSDLSNWTVPAPKEVWSEFDKAVRANTLKHLGAYNVKAQTEDGAQTLFERVVSYYETPAPVEVAGAPA